LLISTSARCPYKEYLYLFYSFSHDLVRYTTWDKIIIPAARVLSERPEVKAMRLFCCPYGRLVAEGGRWEESDRRCL